MGSLLAVPRAVVTVLLLCATCVVHARTLSPLPGHMTLVGQDMAVILAKTRVLARANSEREARIRELQARTESLQQQVSAASTVSLQLLQEHASGKATQGRRGEVEAAGISAFMNLASSNRAGNSEEDEEEQLGAVAYDRGLPRSTVKKVSFDQKQEARTLADSITDAWASKKGEKHCKTLLPDNKVIGAQWNSAFVTKVSTGKVTDADMEMAFKDLGGKNIPVPSGFRRDDHVILHRSGVHTVSTPTVSVGKGDTKAMFLCASWTAVCQRKTPQSGQECVTSRRILKCAKGWDADWKDCNDWDTAAKIALPGFA